MKILVLGMGVIGSVYALRLAKAGHAVTAAARGERLAALRSGGLRIRNAFLDLEESAEVDVVDTLPPLAGYGLVLVALRSGQVDAALRDIAAKRPDCPVLAIGNNLGDLRKQAETVGASRFVPGFGSFGGYREGGIILYTDGRTKEKTIRKHISRTTLGILSEEARPALDAARGILEEAGLPVTESRRMADWLLCHAALVFPLAGAIYATGGDQARFCRTRDAVVMGLRACKEAMRALRAVGHSMEPRSLRKWLGWPEWFIVPVLMKSFAGEGARIAMFGHANAPGGRDEIGGQALVLDGILSSAGKNLRWWKRILPCFAREGVEPLLPDGSRELRLRM